MKKNIKRTVPIITEQDILDLLKEMDKEYKGLYSYEAPFSIAFEVNRLVKRLVRSGRLSKLDGVSLLKTVKREQSVDWLRNMRNTLRSKVRDNVDGSAA